MLNISFDTDNAAFGPNEDDSWVRFATRNEEIKRVLKNVCNQLDNGRTSGVCIDINGNKIGTWSLGMEV